MNTNLQPYPEYKDSGAPWLGEIPAHWSIQRCKRIFRSIDIRSKTGDEELLTVSSQDGVVPRSQKKVTMFMAASYTGYKLCWPGDLVINSLWAWMRGLGFSRYHGIVSPVYSVYRPFSNFSTYWKYFDYLFRSNIYDQELHVRSKGIWTSRLLLSDQDFLDMLVLIPPLDEQQHIVAFLDHFDRRVNRFIRAKRRMIALLNEQKQAIIHQAVTRGLDPDVKLKPSGVEWLGDVPEHWEVRRVRNLVHRIDQGVSPQAEARLVEGEAWGVLKAGCVNRGLFRDTEHKRLPDGFAVDKALAVRVGDVLISRASGSPKLVGSVARVDRLRFRLILSDKTFRLIMQDEKMTEFIVAAMNTRYFRIQIEQAISGAEGLANNLPLSELKDFRIAIPPVSEAQLIAAQLNAELQHIERMSESTQREIDLIREYRTRLIADVVTGKLDLRGVALTPGPSPIAMGEGSLGELLGEGSQELLGEELGDGEDDMAEDDQEAEVSDA